MHQQFPHKLPPYGRNLARLLASGNKPKNCVFVFAGSNAWQSAEFHKHRQAVLLLPPGDDPEHFCWPVAGIDCLVGQQGEIHEETLLRLAHVLLRHGATKVCLIAVDTNGELYTTFHVPIRSESHAA